LYWRGAPRGSLLEGLPPRPGPQLQDDETAEYIKRRGWELTGTYTDHGVSGARERRPELDRLLADARRRRFDVLVVWRSDRMFRSIKNMVVTLEELASLGVVYTSVTEPFNMSCASGRLLTHIVSAMAEFERTLIVERTSAGLAAARRRGVRLGRPPARLDVERIRELQGQGWSIRKIAPRSGLVRRPFNVMPCARGDPQVQARRRTTRSHQTQPTPKNNVVITKTAHASVGSRDDDMRVPAHVRATITGAPIKYKRPRTRCDCR
jgi:DNA invertase Pin-like site-specific DNA recombinase